MEERMSGRGVKVISPLDVGGGEGWGRKDPSRFCPCHCDAAAFFVDGRFLGGGGGGVSTEDDARRRRRQEMSSIKQSLVPGGFICLFFALGPLLESSTDKEGPSICDILSEFWTGTPFRLSVWDVERASLVCSLESPVSACQVRVVSITKRPCPVDASSCPWKDIRRRVSSCLNSPDGREVGVGETWLQYERRVVEEATVCRTAAERRRAAEGKRVAPLSEGAVRRAVAILRTHGFVVLRDMFHPTLTAKWGRAVLSDFAAAADILKKREGVDVINPTGGRSDPVSYREMAMREDLRVDLRDGPAMRALREESNRRDCGLLGLPTDDVDRGPTITTREGIEGSVRFHPSVLEIVRRLFNPHSNHGDGTADNESAETSITVNNGATKKLPLYRGNFGRFNFSGSGPDGSPQPLRVGEVGSVISLPGSADQAVHADAPHLFEHVDCLPCHYANLFTPGADASGGNDGGEEKEEKGAFDEDGNFTGNVGAGGTAFVHGSHRLSVAARLTATEEDEDVTETVAKRTATTTPPTMSAASTERARDEMHLRTVRPSLRPGDALIFDTRTLHFGLANRSGRGGSSGGGGGCSEVAGLEEGEGVGVDMAGRWRPMLYVNLTHAWFHDPKNWDKREEIFPTSGVVGEPFSSL